jgi:hypothetical protein
MDWAGGVGGGVGGVDGFSGNCLVLPTGLAAR